MIRSDDRPWGYFEVLEENSSYWIKRIRLAPGHRLSLQSHKYRREHWLVVEGHPKVTIGEAFREDYQARPGNAYTIPEGHVHRLTAPDGEWVTIIELAYSEVGKLSEDDIKRWSDDYGRAG